MAFSPDKFERAEFEPRTKRVAVPALADFFDDEEPVWEVRGLTSNELYKAFAAEKSQTSVDKVLQSIADGNEQVAALRKAMGLEKGTQGEVAKRLEMLVAGSVSPEIKLPLAVKLAENYPIEFTELTRVISELTGQGYEHVKPQAALLETAS